ncbi:MAG: Asp-tRNA(Asn)/Glu-tRNA(Gln) amidotransferase subunit GatA [Gammaproteobacteria bacterium]|nr:Asp-tRNA(Asn)/Glu-tRNA(Gln) amidotransferase subunit GatA [Gammaproteobacteria bacterium]
MMTNSVTEIRRGLKQGKFSSVEITQDYLARIAQHNPALNCFISVTDEIALEQARTADAALASGEAAPLTGVPLAHKDLFCTDGVKTTCASQILDNFIAPYDATIIENFKRDGAVMLGKTNMDEFAMGSSNENSSYGNVANPWNTDYVPGGSSGGSAAAVAAGLTPAATGTDTGGSIRQPAALCGVTGIKPTYGRVSRYGMIAYGSSLDQGGPFARSAEDCALLLQTMSGFDRRDSTSAEQAAPDYSAALGQGIKGLKIGLPKEYFAEGLDARVAGVIETAIDELAKLGAKIVDVSLPNTGLSIPTYYVIAMAECSSNLSRFDGVRFGHRCQDPVDLEDLYKRSRGEGFGAEVKRRIMIGTYALSAGYYDAYYLKAQQLRRMIKQDFQQAFGDVDLILGPTTPETAFKIGAKTDDPVSMYLQDIYTISLNLAGLPGMSLPVGFSDGLPVGMQLIGNYFDEAGLLNAAHSYQQVSDWHLQVPEAFR